jgi:hypothetical protein
MLWNVQTALIGDIAVLIQNHFPDAMSPNIYVRFVLTMAIKYVPGDV